MIQQNYCNKNNEMQLNVDTESDVTKFFNFSTQGLLLQSFQ